MMALENVSSRKGDGISFTNLNNSFETGRIHGIWNETDSVNTGFLQLLAGNIPLSSGSIRYKGKRLDQADVAYYNRTCMPGPDLTNGPVTHQYNHKLVYLFDNIFDSADMTSIVHLYKIILPLKNMGKTILITSTDHKALRAPADFIHILSNGAFQAKLHCKQYDLLDDVFRHVMRS